MADNFRFDITGAPLGACLEIATHGRVAVVAWRVHEGHLTLYWVHGAQGAVPTPAPLKGEALELFVHSWLQTADYGPEPDIDGSCSKGWRVYNEEWTSVDGQYQALAAIEPTWLLHGK